MSILLITPTGGRQSQINLCANWMKNQTYTGKVTWVIVDDCDPRTTDFIPDDFKENWTIIKEHPIPLWQPGLNTQGRNISVGINIAESLPDIEAIFIIEDDDYYKPIYLERMMLRLPGHNVIGEQNTIYYNVFHRRYLPMHNMQHASLFQVAFTPEVVPVFRKCYAEKFIDAHFFMLLTGAGAGIGTQNSHYTSLLQNARVNLFQENNLAVGIKGIGGRQGIGGGHTRLDRAIPDTDLLYLSKLIGEDSKLYGKFYGAVNKDNGIARQLIFSRRR